jgi:NAD(P)-dependent dehydrogenase (short-subunit alcohol dehydrogenase family)
MAYLETIFNLSNKTVVLTGAGGHLCSAMARGYAYCGCKVLVTDMRFEKAKKVVESLQSEGFQRVEALEVDVTKKIDFVKALAVATDKFGSADVLVNGAGINGATPFFEISEEEWNKILSSQLTGTMLGCQVFGEYMVERGSGVIVNISSASAGPPLSKAFTYSVAKAGILNLTQNLAREWGDKGVRVNAVRPGFFPTEWNKKNFISVEREAAILGHTPMRRFGDPEELIGAMLWLVSDAAEFVTGAEIAVDGGFSCMTI